MFGLSNSRLNFKDLTNYNINIKIEAVNLSFTYFYFYEQFKFNCISKTVWKPTLCL